MKRNSIQMFPRAAFAPLSHHFQPWFGEHLRVLEEAPLHIGVDRLTIRALWLRTFHAPVVVRVSGPPWELHAKTSSQLTGYRARQITYREHRTLDATQSGKLEEHFRAIELWYRPDPPQLRKRSGSSHWLLEAATKDRYRVVRSYAPQDHAIRRFCLALVELSRVPVPAKAPLPRNKTSNFNNLRQ